MSDDVLDFIPLFPDDDEDAILARMRAWANEGLDPDVDVDTWTDTREGSHWHVAVMPVVREFARLYDLAGTEVPASGFPVWAWADYLDDHAEVYDMLRLVATKATVIVTFAGDPGVVVPVGQVVGVEPATPEDDAPEFATLTTATIGGGGVVDVTAEATEAGVAGNVAANAIVSISGSGLADVSVVNDDPATGGTDAETDDALRERLLALFGGPGGGNVFAFTQWSRDTPGVGRVTVVPLFAGAGTVLVIVSTADGTAVAQTVVDALQNKLDPPSAMTVLDGAQNLDNATIYVDTTSGFRTEGVFRVGDSLVPYTGVTPTTFTGCTGPNEPVADNAPVTQSGRGHGLAFVGQHVVVVTADPLEINVGATIEYEEGYSRDGDGGTIALGGALREAIRSYVESVQPGGEIVVKQIEGRITQTVGVHDVQGTTINASAVNLAVLAVPPHVPILNLVTLATGAF